MFSLVAPTPSLFPSFVASHAEWAGAWQDGAGPLQADDVESLERFTTWVQRLNQAPFEPERDGMVPCTYHWIVDGPEYVGAIAFRHHLTPALLESGGHIGYGIRPSRRKEGAATWALKALCQQLADARTIDRVLLTCDDANVASIATIEKCGGQLEDIRQDDKRFTRRYWIDLTEL